MSSRRPSGLSGLAASAARPCLVRGSSGRPGQVRRCSSVARACRPLGASASAVLVAGECVVVGDSDPGGLGGQVVVHQPGGPDGPVPDPFGGVDHVRRWGVVGLGDAAQQPGAALRPQLGVPGDPGRGGGTGTCPTRRRGRRCRRVPRPVRRRVGRSAYSCRSWCTRDWIWSSSRPESMFARPIGTLIPGVDRQTMPRPSSSSWLDRTDAMRARKLNQKPFGNPLSASLTRGFRRKTGKSVSPRRVSAGGRLAEAVFGTGKPPVSPVAESSVSAGGRLAAAYRFGTGKTGKGLAEHRIGRSAEP